MFVTPEYTTLGRRRTALTASSRQTPPSPRPLSKGITSRTKPTCRAHRTPSSCRTATRRAHRGNVCVGKGITYNNHDDGDEGLDTVITDNTIIRGSLRFGGVSGSVHKRSNISGNTIVEVWMIISRSENIRLSGHTISVGDDEENAVSIQIVRAFTAISGH